MQNQRSDSIHLLASVEEKFFPIKLLGNEQLIQKAMEHALGTSLECLASGFWVGRMDVFDDAWMDVTVRALPVESGTTVEVRLQPKWTMKWGWLYATVLAVGCVTLVPLIWVIWYSHKRNDRINRQRLVILHRIWTELSEAIGAPMRAPGYRASPQRIYEPADRLSSVDEQVEHEAAAAEEEAESANADLAER